MTFTLSQQIKHLREKRGWSVDEFSEESGLKKSLVENIEEGFCENLVILEYCAASLGATLEIRLVEDEQ